jgi:hypothetical protein
MALQIDHVLYGVRDLEAAGARFLRDYGLWSAEGGRHPELGTANRIIPVGRGVFVELIAVVDAASGHPLADALGEAVSAGDRLFGYCLRPDDLDDVARRLSIPALRARRRNVDGTEHEWRLAGLEAAFGPERLPFFIDWGKSPGWEHLQPQQTLKTHGIAWLEVGGDEARVRQWIGDDYLPLRFAGGEAGPQRLAIATPNGQLVIE